MARRATCVIDRARSVQQVFIVQAGFVPAQAVRARALLKDVHASATTAPSRDLLALDRCCGGCIRPIGAVEVLGALVAEQL